MASKIAASETWIVHAVTAFLLVTEDAQDEGVQAMAEAVRWGGNIVPAAWILASKSQSKKEFTHHFAQGLVVVGENHRRFLEAVLFKVGGDS